MKTALLVGFIAVLVFTSACAQRQETQNTQDIQDKKYCQSDLDCAGATCCHPDDVLNKKYAPDCTAAICTQVCLGPLDCNAGKIECIENRCTIIKKAR